jgi:hypothetical protein
MALNKKTARERRRRRRHGVSDFVTITGLFEFVTDQKSKRYKTKRTRRRSFLQIFPSPSTTTKTIGILAQ